MKGLEIRTRPKRIKKTCQIFCLSNLDGAKSNETQFTLIYFFLYKRKIVANINKMILFKISTGASDSTEITWLLTYGFRGFRIHLNQIQKDTPAIKDFSD